MNQLKLLVLALGSLTRIPFPAGTRLWAGDSPERQARACRYLPLVGAVQALLMALAYAPSALWLPQSISVVLALSFGLWLGGARHEAAWARYCANLAGGERSALPPVQAPQGRTDVASASAIGALALIMMMAVKIEALASLDPTWVGVSLLAAQVWSRVCMVWVMRSLAPAQSSALSGKVGGWDLCVALAVGLGLIALAVWLASSLRPFVVGGLVSLVGAALMRRSMKRRLGGHDANGLGAVQQWAEALFYLGIVAALGAENVEVTVDPAS